MDYITDQNFQRMISSTIILYACWTLSSQLRPPMSFLILYEGGLCVALDFWLLSNSAMAAYWRVCEVLTFAAFFVLAYKMKINNHAGTEKQAPPSDTEGRQED